MTDESNEESKVVEVEVDASKEVEESLTSLSDIFSDASQLDSDDASKEVEKGAVIEEPPSSKAKDDIDASKDADASPKADTLRKATEDSKEVAGLNKALLAERRKRQEAEKLLKEKDVSQVVEVPDLYDDPEGYAKYLEGKTSTAAVTLKFNLSRGLLIDSKEDYSSMEKLFIELTEDEDGNVTDVALHNEMLSSNNPASFIYNHAKQHLEIETLKDPKYKENLENELREKILREIKDKGLEATQVPNLNAATASGNNSSIAEKEITSISELFKA